MIKKFFKKNWGYLILLIFIIILNIGPGTQKKEEPLEDTKIEAQVAPEEEESLFLDFDEAKTRAGKIENLLNENPPIYFFYISFNLLLFVIFLSGVWIFIYFVISLIKKRDPVKRLSSEEPPSWQIGDIFRIVILGLSLSYVFFIVFGFFVGMIESVAGTKFTFYKSENFRMIFDTIILDLMVFLVILAFLHNVYKKKISSFGFVKKNLGKNIFYGVAGYVGIIPVLFAIGILVYVILNIFKIKPPPQPIIGLFLEEKNTALLFISSMIAATFGPIIEEIFFRGVMYNAVKKKIGVFWSILITSMLFSFLHTHAMTYFLVGFIPITILGILLAYLYEKTGSLIPSITLHVCNNVGSVIMVFIYKYFNSLIG